MSLISNIVFMPSFNITILDTDTYENRIAPKRGFQQSMQIHNSRPTYQKENNTNSYVGKDNAHPDFIGQRVQKGENTWFGFLWLFNHDGDSQRHEGFGEIYHLFTDKSDCQGSNSYICFLLESRDTVTGTM